VEDPYNPPPWNPYMKTGIGTYACQWDEWTRTHFPEPEWTRPTTLKERRYGQCDEERPHTHTYCLHPSVEESRRPSIGERMLLGAVLADREGRSWARCEDCGERMFVGTPPLLAS